MAGTGAAIVVGGALASAPVNAATGNEICRIGMR
jgi:hypothetical protein